MARLEHFLERFTQGKYGMREIGRDGFEPTPLVREAQEDRRVNTQSHAIPKYDISSVTILFNIHYLMKRDIVIPAPVISSPPLPPPPPSHDRHVNI